MTLRDRCKEFYRTLTRNATLRQGSPVDDIEAFVLAEKGRAADDSLKDTLPLVLYFGTPEDREEFVSLVMEAKPNMIAKRMP